MSPQYARSTKWRTVLLLHLRRACYYNRLPLFFFTNNTTNSGAFRIISKRLRRRQEIVDALLLVKKCTDGQTVGKLQGQKLYCYHMKKPYSLIDFLEENDGFKNRHRVSLRTFEENILFISSSFLEFFTTGGCQDED